MANVNVENIIVCILAVWFTVASPGIHESSRAAEALALHHQSIGVAEVEADVTKIGRAGRKTSQYPTASDTTDVTIIDDTVSSHDTITDGNESDSNESFGDLGYKSDDAMTEGYESYGDLGYKSDDATTDAYESYGDHGYNSDDGMTDGYESDDEQTDDGYESDDPFTGVDSCTGKECSKCDDHKFCICSREVFPNDDDPRCMIAL